MGQKATVTIISKGGPGSGHFGHSGRPGKRGGSLPGGGSGAGESLKPWKDAAYGDIAEEVPISTIERYAEHKWSRDNSRLSSSEWDALKDDISKNGIKEPLMLEYNPEKGMAILTEGNHRLAIVKELGWSKVPVRIRRSTYAGNDMFGRSKEVPNSKLVTDEYVPGDMSPGDVFPESVLKAIVTKGGPGSGHFGHAGRPGKRGGSLPGTGGASAAAGDGSPRQEYLLHCSFRDWLPHRSRVCHLRQRRRQRSTGVARFRAMTMRCSKFGKV